MDDPRIFVEWCRNNHPVELRKLEKDINTICNRYFQSLDMKDEKIALVNDMIIIAVEFAREINKSILSIIKEKKGNDNE